MKATVAPHSHSTPAAPARRPRSFLRAGFDWLLAGSHPEPDELRNELLHQRASMTKTLAVAIFASLLTATIAACLTGAAWAYAWMAAEMVLGSLRVHLMLKDVAKAKAAQRTGTSVAWMRVMRGLPRRSAEPTDSLALPSNAKDIGT